MNNKPKVSVMCFSDNNGGMELDAIKLAALLSEACEVTLFCKSESFIHHQLKNQNHIDFVPIKFFSRKFSLSMLFSVRDEIKKRKINNVIFFGASELKTLYFSFLWLNLNVIVRHGTTKSHRKSGFLHRLVYSCVEYHVAISKHLINNIKTIVPYGRKTQFKIIYPSFQFAEHKNLLVDKNQIIKIIHVARVVPGKGHRDAILACASLYDNGIEFELLFVGSIDKGKYIDEIMDLVNSLPYKSSIQFCGYIHNVEDYLVKADLFLYPSYGEGFGNVFAEAMGFGLSAVTYDNTTFPEFVDMGFKFRMAEDRNIEALASELLHAAVDVKDARKKVDDNIALATELFNREREKRDWCLLLE